MGTEKKTNGDSVSRGVAALGAGLALAVGFFLGFTVHGMLGGKATPPPSANTAVETAQSPATPAVSGPLAERIRTMEKQVQLEPNNPAAWTELGNLYFDTKQPDKAIAAYEKSLTLRPGNPDVLTDLGVMYRQVGKFDQAIASFDKAIAANPDHIIAHYNKSIVLEFDKHDKAAALAVLRALAARKPDAVLPGGRSVDQAIKDLSEK